MKEQPNRCTTLAVDSDSGSQREMVKRQSTMSDDRWKSENEKRGRNRRNLLSGIGAAIVFGMAGCTENANEGNEEQERNRDDVTSPTPSAPSNGSSVQEHEKNLSAALEAARFELDAAYSEIHSADLIQPKRKEWTPQSQKLGNLDLSVIRTHTTSARNSLSEASDYLETRGDGRSEFELFRQMVKLAEDGAEFYHAFALTFEKIYQYEFLIGEKGEHDLAVEKIAKAIELLGDWDKYGETLKSDIETLSATIDESPTAKSRIPSFDLQKWNIIEDGLREYPSRLEPRLRGFESYAEARELDKRGVDDMIEGDFETAQEKFVEARTNIDRAQVRFTTVESGYDNFFAERAAVYENRVSGLDKGFLLHLRAANAYVDGETDEAERLQFDGTRKILKTLDEYQIED